MDAEKNRRMASRRKYPRRRYRRVVGVLHKGNFWLTRAEEIGEGGILVNSTRGIPSGDQVILSIIVPNTGDVAVIRSEVRYELNGREPSEKRVGFQFINFSFKHKKKIRDYIAAKSESEAESERD
jgi:c-di-GMP-binding flagellar brake protein YcgR